MIVTEQLIINDKQFTKTYSDQNMMIERDGVQYSEAIDPTEFGRTYTETDIPIEPVDPTAEAEKKAETDLTVSDTLEMLNDLGVDTNDN